MATRKSCGTCLHWQGEEIDGMRQCQWPRPEMPFWASISEGHDHDDWTKATDGRGCRAHSPGDAE